MLRLVLTTYFMEGSYKTMQSNKMPHVMLHYKLNSDLAVKLVWLSFIYFFSGLKIADVLSHLTETGNIVVISSMNSGLFFPIIAGKY